MDLTPHLANRTTSSLIHMRAIDRWKGPLIAALTCFIISTSLAGAKVAIRGGFGAGDLLPFFFWTIPLSFLIGAVKLRLVAPPRLKSLALTYVLASFVGVVIGLLWTLTVALWIGPFFRAFSFEVLTCWLLGSASGLIVTWHNGSAQSLQISVAIVLLIWLGGLVGDRTLVSRLTNSREIEIVTVKWTSGPQPLLNVAILGNQLSASDLDRLKSIGLSGQVEFASSGIFGEGKHGKAIIVMTEHLTHPVSLAQPDGSEVVYLQTPEGWKMYPANAATLKRNIQLWPDEREPARVTRYAVENADGSRQGGTLATW
jgi:hypothetical protein